MTIFFTWYYPKITLHENIFIFKQNLNFKVYFSKCIRISKYEYDKKNKNIKKSRLPSIIRAAVSPSSNRTGEAVGTSVFFIGRINS